MCYLFERTHLITLFYRFVEFFLSVNIDNRFFIRLFFYSYSFNGEKLIETITVKICNICSLNFNLRLISHRISITLLLIISLYLLVFVNEKTA